jgi:protein-arginine kinase activator protein McsA
MSVEKEVLKRLLDWHILAVEIDKIKDAKIQAIKDHTFEKAATLRDQELKLAKLIPTLDNFKLLRSQLDEE